MLRPRPNPTSRSGDIENTRESRLSRHRAPAWTPYTGCPPAAGRRSEGFAAQARGHALFHYAPEDLNYADGRLWTQARPVTVQRVEGDHHRFGDEVRLDLGSDIDVVLMRQDPPFDLGYITATHLLERIQSETLVVNDPASVRNAPEKVWVLDYARFMPPTLVTRSLDEARTFLAEHGEIVVKPLHGKGNKNGEGVGGKGDGGTGGHERGHRCRGRCHHGQPYLAWDRSLLLVFGFAHNSLSVRVFGSRQRNVIRAVGRS